MVQKLIGLLLFFPHVLVGGYLLLFHGGQFSLSVDWWKILLLLGWWVSFTKNAGLHLYQWQRCEYRWDRFWDFLGTKAGKKYLFNVSTILYVAVCVLFLGIFGQGVTPLQLSSGLLGFVVFLLGYHVIEALWVTFTRRLYLPVYTKAAIINSMAYGWLELYLVFTFPLVGLVFVEVFRGALIGLFIQLMNIIFLPILKLQLRQAHKARQTMPFTHVIGIVGAYGKTTVKEFLVHLLKERYALLVTPRRVNTEKGIAQLLRKHRYKKEELFVCEMGGYKKGEVKTISEVVMPDMAIMAGVGNQHAALYGSEKAVLEGDFEAMHALPEGGKAYLVEHKYPEELLTNTKASITYVSEKNPFCLEAFEQKLEGSRMSYTYEGKNYMVDLPLWGKHHVRNIFLAMTVAMDLGLSMEEIVPRLGTLVLPEGSLSVSQGENGLIIINDTYNGNIQGIQAALEVLKNMQGKKKWVITQGVLELGKLEKGEHITLGQRIGEVADGLVMTREDVIDPLVEGVAGRIPVDVCLDYDALMAWCSTHLRTGDIVLLANRLPGNSAERLFTLSLTQDL